MLKNADIDNLALPAKWELMVEKALTARENAYAPYSNFFVGASILSDDGNIYYGCNVENASYPMSNCAEAHAIAMMAVHGARYIKDILVIGGAQLTTPCGGCRQKIREFADKNTRVFIASPTTLLKCFSFFELLPYSFGPEIIGITN